MTRDEIAKLITGRQYRDETTNEIEQAAKKAGLVIVFGASDDLMEFRGAIYDEVGAYGGTIVQVDDQGLIPTFSTIDKDGRDAKDELRNFFERDGRGKTISAVWAQKPYSWSFTTDIPHATFEILEDDDPYCKGIVFALADAKAQMPKDELLMALCAIRYTMGRQSYIVADGQRWARDYGRDKWVRDVLIRDLEEAVEGADRGFRTLGMEMDETGWRAVLAALKAMS